LGSDSLYPTSTSVLSENLQYHANASSTAISASSGVASNEEIVATPSIPESLLKFLADRTTHAQHHVIKYVSSIASWCNSEEYYCFR
jgi:hypothetical protein